MNWIYCSLSYKSRIVRWPVWYWNEINLYNSRPKKWLIRLASVLRFASLFVSWINLRLVWAVLVIYFGGSWINRPHLNTTCLTYCNQYIIVFICWCIHTAFYTQSKFKCELWFISRVIHIQQGNRKDLKPCWFFTPISVNWKSGNPSNFFSVL